jgi:hypothetical protein
LLSLMQPPSPRRSRCSARRCRSRYTSA